MSTRRELANAIRFLSADAVQKANSGHPGMPMGMADIAEVLWNDFLSHNPSNPQWCNRDRFVVSNGHGSMLHYSLLHLAGYDVSLDELKNFRQLHSKTPGHPEVFETPGIETTTGPLGQGFANAVGMALAEQVLANRFNQPDHTIVDHHTYVFVGDGCLMEGISHEAASLAGTWGLGKLICLYDDNGISIDGDVKGWFTEQTKQRFESYGWYVIDDVDGHDAESIRAAIAAAKEVIDKPTLICCKTTIGFGSPNKAGSAKSHGAPLGEDELALMRQELAWPHPAFDVPADIKDAWLATASGKEREDAWQQTFDAYAQAHPDLAAEFLRRLRGELPEGFHQTAEAYIAQCQQEGQNIASRKASQMAIEAFAPHLPEMIGGSADLACSNLVHWSGSKDVMSGDADSNTVFYGVREFAMSAISNGLELHGGFIPFDATFLVFSDYARNAVRMSALMPSAAIHVYTHDSIGLGEDGPTHQPIEHLSSLRVIPNNHVWRPCDTVETAVAWHHAISERKTPSCLVFSRQSLPHQNRNEAQMAAIARGGYILSQPMDGIFEAILIATGSEVGMAMQAHNLLRDEGITTRVVSMPCTNVFDAQPKEYRDAVLPPEAFARVAVEAGHPDFWHKYVGLQGHIIGINRFGASAPGATLYEHFGFTVDAICEAVRALTKEPEVNL